MSYATKGCLLTPDDLSGDHWGAVWLVLPDLQLAVHLAPDARVTPIDLAAVVAARALQVEEDTDGERINPTVGEMSDALHYVHQLVTNFACLLLSAGEAAYRAKNSSKVQLPLLQRSIDNNTLGSEDIWIDLPTVLSLTFIPQATNWLPKFAESLFSTSIFNFFFFF